MTAPIFRSVEQHTGEVAHRPSKWWAAFDEADERCEEFECLREENAQLRGRIDELDGIANTLLNEKAALRAERDDLADRLVSMGEAHQIMLGLLAAARNERDNHQWEVSR